MKYLQRYPFYEAGSSSLLLLLEVLTIPITIKMNFMKHGEVHKRSLKPLRIILLRKAINSVVVPDMGITT